MVPPLTFHPSLDGGSEGQREGDLHRSSVWSHVCEMHSLSRAPVLQAAPAGGGTSVLFGPGDVQDPGRFVDVADNND